MQFDTDTLKILTASLNVFQNLLARESGETVRLSIEISEKIGGQTRVLMDPLDTGKFTSSTDANPGFEAGAGITLRYPAEPAMLSVITHMAWTAAALQLKRMDPNHAADHIATGTIQVQDWGSRFTDRFVMVQQRNNVLTFDWYEAQV